MSFFKKLFGIGSEGAQPSKREPIEHEGYQITAMPISDGGQYRICAEISREIDGEVKTHRMIRADTFPDAESAADATYRKAKQMIREQGDRIF